ncbi:MAG: hypothetical protein RL368_969, partial [Pseudomonadota bacterium]
TQTVEFFKKRDKEINSYDICVDAYV